MEKRRREDDGTCASGSYLALLGTQFLGSLNDNVYKLVVSFVILATVPSEDEAALYISLAGAMFVIPWVLFSSYAGFFADKYQKSSVIKLTKVLELGVMSLGAYFFMQESVVGLLVVLFLMGLQSMLFSPSKYGILPELLRAEHLSKGNGYVEALTFLAIIIGTASAGPIKALSGDSLLLPSVIVLSLAILGLFTCLGIKPCSSPQLDKEFELNPFKDIYHSLCEVKQNKNLFLAVLAISYFWLVAAAFQLNILLYSSHVMELEEYGTTILLCALALGIGVGSILAGFVSEGKVELGLVPIGSVGISLMSVLLAFSHCSVYLTVAVLFLLGVSAGLYSVPLNAYIQRESPSETRGRFIAAANFTSFSGMLIASGYIWFSQHVLGLAADTSFLVLGVISSLVTVYIVYTMPEILARCLNWLLAHTFYRLDVRGLENVPKEGGALIVCNHVSFVDPPLLLASVERPIRFLMFRPLYEAPGLHQVAKLMKAIPISGADGKEGVMKSLAQAREYVEQGEIVGIFAEGGITRTGHLLQFRRGLETIMEGLDAPIIPAYLDQIWGSIFSYQKKKFVWKIPKKIPYRLGVFFGEPLAADTKAPEVRQAVQELAVEAVKNRSREDTLLHQSFVSAARRSSFRTMLEDSGGKRITGLGALARVMQTMVLLEQRSGVCKRVALRLKPSVDTALMLVGVVASGKLPIMIPDSWDEARVLKFIDDYDVSAIVVDREYSLPRGNLIPISDFARTPSVFSLLWAAIGPKGIVRRSKRTQLISADDAAVVVFPRSDRDPRRAVMLSHRNISFNVDALYDLYQLAKSDSIVGNLASSHAAGNTLNVWLPLCTGMKVVFPKDGEDLAGVVSTISAHRISTLFASSGNLSELLEHSTKEQLASLKHLVVGAERLSPETREKFIEKFEIVPREGFGASELSPIALVNVADFEHHRYPQAGDKPGTAGHPLAGVAVKIVHPENGEECAQGEEGVLLIAGAGVMKGYLDQADLTKETVVDGWFRTTQLATVDEDGFVWLRDSES